MNRTGKPYEMTPTACDIAVVVKTKNINGESPIWCPKSQQLYWVDIRGKLIQVLRPADGSYRSFALPDWVTSLSTRAGGGLVLTMRKTFAFYDPDTGVLEPLANPEPDRPENRFNDGKCDRQGRLWAGTMHAEDWHKPTGALYRFEPNQRITSMQDHVKCSNGTGWSPDGRTMYYTDSFRYSIFAFDFDPAAGDITNRRPFVTLDPAGPGFPDGLTVDSEGFVWSAQPVFGRIVRYDPAGKMERIIALPVSRGLSVTFGGTDFRTLYIPTATETLTEAEVAEEPLAGSLLACEPGVQGIAETPFAG